MYALVVITPFLNYQVGQVITDPAAIVTIIGGPYRGCVARIAEGGGAEALTVAVTSAYLGLPLGLSGTVSDAAPAALDYSTDGGASWQAVGNYEVAAGIWSGTGPVLPSVQAGMLMVRDHAGTGLPSQAANFQVVLPGNAGTGTLALADGSAVRGIGAGLVAGSLASPGTLAANFGTLSGQVADGGGLAAAMGSLTSLSGALTAEAAARASGDAVNEAAAAAAMARAQAALPLEGGTLTGALMLAADPVTAGQAATKTYVDTGVADALAAAASAASLAAAALPRAGGTLTGGLTLAADPVGTAQAATKNYVDTSTAGAYAAAATAQSTANAALSASSGTLSTALAFTSSGTISAANNLVLAPANQLWLGAQAGSGAVYSATIAGVVSNPGTAAAGKIWNNGGVLCLAGAAPLPAFAGGFIASQNWTEATGSAAIFSHAPVPVPPASQSGLLVGDKLKLSGIYNFAEVFAPQQTYDAWPSLQNYLLYAQLMYRAQKGSALDSVAERDFVDVYLPAGDFMVSQPLIVPENVRLGGPGRILRAPYTTNQANNGTTSVPGPFASLQQLPTVVVAPRGHLSDLNIYCTTDGVFAHRGSGVCMGKNWQAAVGAGCAIGNPGSGYSVGDLFVAANPSAAPFSGFVAQVTAVNGSGGITAATVTLGGAYALPPAATMYNNAASLQLLQWTAANGFTVFDTANPGCFLQQAAFRSNFSTPSPGTGATMAPTWQADFTSTGGSYLGGAALTCGSQAGRIQITGGIPDAYSAEYGPSFNVMLCGLEFEIDSIQGLGGHAGLWANYAQDARIGRMNFVETNIGVWARGAGSIACANVVLDTCGCVGVIDESHGIRLHGRAFWEEGNLSINAPLINTQGAALVIGSASNSTYPCSCLDIKFTVINMGGLPASTIAAHPGTPLAGYPATQQAACAQLSYLFSSVIDLTVSNTSQYGGAVSPLPTSGIYQLGFNVDSGNDLRGSIDTVPVIDGAAPPAQVVTSTTGHGFPGCAIRVWDGLHQCWVGPYNTVEMFGATAPASSTGAGLATPGSTYVDTASAAGRRYVNTGTQSAPVWS